jgi:hypothetical protein
MLKSVKVYEKFKKKLSVLFYVESEFKNINASEIKFQIFLKCNVVYKSLISKW